ncbi:glycosyltransferase family 10 domain-containing protein [Hymenobacter qilianensis]|uniref:Fucosyltransferase C-terminal domain-containing protein n=1 Tax=Hymenobacter qilianensis TaxID=1385715 RepID=A0A7H0GWG4_9BACT|nr:glycosyltransferase family 10 [Hymenobacter qilianensis]QNP52630.1 hypothetical protein H9L05_02385 [Hymenobacter qilianensis]
MKATLYVREDPVLLENRIFSGESLYGMKSDTYLYVALRDELAKKGVDLATQDIHPPEDSDLIISLDQPLYFQNFTRTRPSQKLHLILTEPATYYPDNWLSQNHASFDKILTYDYSRVDNKRYFHFYFSIDFEDFPPYKRPSEQDFNDRRLCVLMAAAFGVAKPPKGSGSLLHERYLTLRWFSKHHPDEFDLYTRGISSSVYSSFRGAGLLGKVMPQGIMNLIAAQRKKIFARVDRGSAAPDQKIQTLQRYRFSISYENTGDTPGCLSEKIFDSFAAGCVPIYLGHQEVDRLVPSDCFINRRDFKNHEELYQYTKTMTYQQYTKYLDCIESFLNGSQIKMFSKHVNARSMAEVLLMPV